MKKYYIGTTLENLVSIIKDGKISKTPPHRVWKEYSQEYVYLVPYQVDDIHDLFEENPKVLEKQPYPISTQYCFEQANFAIYEFDHTKRVVLEVTGLDESYVTTDHDARGICAMKYSLDIPIENISNIFVDKLNLSEDIQTLISIIKYQKKHSSNMTIMNRFKVKYFDYDDNERYEELSEEDIAEQASEIEESLGVNHIGKLYLHNDFDGLKSINGIYEDLHTSLDCETEFYTYSLEEFKSYFMNLKAA